MNNEIVNVTNKALVAFLLKNDVKPINMFIGRNETIVFQYKIEDTQLLYEEWTYNKH